MGKTLVLMRGTPGSGKSTVAKAIAAAHNGVICSTDDFFLDKDGVYQFDTSKLYANHMANQRKAKALMEKGHECVIIDNTNITRKDMSFYVNTGKEHGYTVQYVSVQCDVELCIKRNTHNVPAEVIRAMAAKFQHDPIKPEGV